MENGWQACQSYILTVPIWEAGESESRLERSYHIQIAGILTSRSWNENTAGQMMDIQGKHAYGGAGAVFEFKYIVSLALADNRGNLDIQCFTIKQWQNHVFL